MPYRDREMAFLPEGFDSEYTEVIETSLSTASEYTETIKTALSLMAFEKWDEAIEKLNQVPSDDCLYPEAVFYSALCDFKANRAVSAWLKALRLHEALKNGRVSLPYKIFTLDCFLLPFKGQRCFPSKEAVYFLLVTTYIKVLYYTSGKIVSIEPLISKLETPEILSLLTDRFFREYSRLTKEDGSSEKQEHSPLYRDGTELKEAINLLLEKRIPGGFTNAMDAVRASIIASSIGMTHKAIEILTTGVALFEWRDSNDEELYIHLARVCREAGMERQALAVLEHGLLMKPKSGEIFENLVLQYQRRKEYWVIHELIDNTIKRIMPALTRCSIPELTDVLFYWMRRLKRSSELLEILTKLEKSRPLDHSELTTLGHVQLHVGDLESASKTLELIRQKGERSPSLSRRLAILRKKQADKKALSQVHENTAYIAN